MSDLFVVSYATMPFGHMHDSTDTFMPVFVAGTNIPAFFALPKADHAYYVTYVCNNNIVNIWRRNKDTNQFEKQYRVSCITLNEERLLEATHGCHHGM
jgi:hypothetical protein